MKLLFRAAAILCLFAVQAPALAQAQSFPSRPVHLVVPYPPGGMADLLGRMAGQGISEGIGQPVVIDNKPGANGAIGTAGVATAPADGYSILLGASSTHVLTPLLTKAPYDAERDFTALRLMVLTPLVLVVNPALPVNSVTELVAWLRANPSKASYGSYGQGSASHLAGELFKATTGVEMVHAPYRGVALALNDLMASELAFVFSDMSATPLIRAGKLKGLGVTVGRRSPSLPEIPTVGEAGLPGFEVYGWFAMYAPAGLPAPVLSRIESALGKYLDDPRTSDRLVELGLVPVTGAEGASPALVSLMRRETDKWRKVIEDARIKIE